jgi:tagatose 6-phosphate kinase
MRASEAGQIPEPPGVSGVILTVTLNPALDLTYAVDALIPYGTHRVATVAERAGGKGLNVARVLHGAGQPVLATGLLGGATGARVAALLGDGLPASFVPIAAETRRTVAVTDRQDATGFWEPGPGVTPGEWAAFVAHFRGLLGEAEVVALCGSLPPGVPVDGYATLIRLAAASGARTVLDTSGEPLRHGLGAGPDLAKPNAAELAALLGAMPGTLSGTSPGVLPGALSGALSGVLPGALPDALSGASPGVLPGASPGGGVRGDLADAVRARACGARAVVVSHGPRGLLAVTGDGAWRGVPPQRVTGNTTGAGDACVAALARGLRAGTPWPALLADAVALSAAAVAAPVAGAIDEETYRRTLPGVIVTAMGMGGTDVHADC